MLVLVVSMITAGVLAIFEKVGDLVVTNIKSFAAVKTTFTDVV